MESRRPRTRWRPSIAAAVAVALQPALLAVALAAPATAATASGTTAAAEPSAAAGSSPACAQVTIIGAVAANRAASEVQGAVSGLAAAVQQQLPAGTSVAAVPVVYSGPSFALQTPVPPEGSAELQRQLDAYSTGGRDALARVLLEPQVNSLVAGAISGNAAFADALATVRGQCPQTRVVLIGYSQGALALRAVLSSGDAAVIDYVAANVAVAAFIGDPLQASVVPSLAGGATGSARGWGTVAFGAGVAPVAPQLAGRTIAFCATGDLVCDFDTAAIVPATAPSDPAAVLADVQGVPAAEDAGIVVHGQAYNQAAVAQAMAVAIASRL